MSTMAYEAIFSFEYLATSIRSKGKIGKEKRGEQENRERWGGEEEGRRHQPHYIFWPYPLVILGNYET